MGLRSGSVRDPLIKLIRGPFGLRSGQFRNNIFGAKSLKFQKNSICAAVAAAAGALLESSRRPEDCRPEGPRRGGDSRTN